MKEWGVRFLQRLPPGAGSRELSFLIKKMRIFGIFSVLAVGPVRAITVQGRLEKGAPWKAGFDVSAG